MPVKIYLAKKHEKRRKLLDIDPNTISDCSEGLKKFNYLNLSDHIKIPKPINLIEKNIYDL